MRALLQAGFRQREERVKVLIPSRMRAGGAWTDVCIHNVSSRGLMAGCDAPPPSGEYVEIRRGTIVIVGRVRWTDGRFFGVQAQDRLSVRSLIDEPRLTSRPKPANEVPTEAERRSNRRLEVEAQMARRLERSRAFASAFQYALAAAVVLIVAGLGASMVYDTLSRPAQQITQAMSGAAAQP
ncbi:hypothetical protein ASG29_11125 [Sphingomonas sp. Leaf412]|uniref:PilZ domain-containing protein n=1 Tax=Sphingomonas sp. Leaf412 TaxID=1736370 RepID=UPI0006F59949|nr:PilZ domain-containing protein [Sphingomonas sp. Leaf412]KQT32347.1 hypothetical protein ASG29_11125 [Sphingomonas sp. Leaf412]